jgi:hypothetical protein
LEEFRQLMQFLLLKSASDIRGSEKILKSLIFHLPGLLAQLRDGDGSPLALYRCMGCIAAGLEGLTRGAASALGVGAKAGAGGTSGSDPDSSRIRGGIRDIRDENVLSFWTPVDWPSLPWRIANASDNSAEIQCISSVVDDLFISFFMTESVRSDMTILLVSQEWALYAGAGEDLDGDVPALRDLVLHLLYQSLLLWGRGERSAASTAHVQALAPHLLNVLGEGSSGRSSMAAATGDANVVARPAAVGTSPVAVEYIARALALMCIVQTEEGEGTGQTARWVVDIAFVQSLSLSLRHKAAAVSEATSSSSSSSSASGCVRCLQAVAEVLVCVPLSAAGGAADGAVSREKPYEDSMDFCVSFCSDLVQNAVECLEQYTGGTISEADSEASRQRQQFLKPSLFSRGIEASSEEAACAGLAAGSGTRGEGCQEGADGLVVAVLHMLGAVVTRAAAGRSSLGSCDGNGYMESLSSRLWACRAEDRTADVLVALIRAGRQSAVVAKR